MSVAATERQFGLDVLRATAALMVVAAHGMMYAAAKIPALILPGVILATLGVEIFFVLSGFLIAPGLFAVAEGRMTASRFWLRRAWRTLPSYYIFLGINLLIAAWFAHDRVPDVSYLFFSQSLIAPPASTFFAESWSLAVEEWFYLSAAIAAALSFKFAGKTGAQFRGWLWVLVLLSPIARAAWSVAQGYEWDAGLRKLTLLRMDAIAIGVLMAAQIRGGVTAAAARWCAWMGGVVCVLAIVYIGYVVSTGQYLAPTNGWGVALCGAVALSAVGAGTALVLPEASMMPRPRAAKPLARVISKIALWSYALYLCHFPLLLLFDQFFPGLRAGESLALALGLALWSVAVVVFAAIFYAQIERRALALRDRFLA
jgi:peptidoglycan/LPS O-acetylase OafA/YrhL